METYIVWLLKTGSFQFWTGRNWDIRCYKAKCYGTKEQANEARAAATKKALNPVEVVEGRLTVPK